MDSLLVTIDFVRVIRLALQCSAALLSLLFGAFLLWQARGKRGGIVLAGISLASGHYNLFQILFFFFPQHSWLFRFAYVGAIGLIPLAIEFPNAIIRDLAISQRLRWAGYGATLLFFAALPTVLMFSDSPGSLEGEIVMNGGPLLAVFALVMALLLVRMAWMLTRAIWRCEEELQKRRLEFILAAEGFYSLCALHDILLMLRIFWIFPFPIVEAAALGFILIAGYAVLKFRLMDIEVVIGEGVYYVLLTLSIAWIYSSLSSLGEKLVSRWYQQQPYWMEFLPAIIVTAIFWPLAWLLRKAMDRYFLPEEVRDMKVFQHPNFHLLFLDGRAQDLTALRDEIDRLGTVIREKKRETPR